jgi:hypothetical protein
MRTVGDEPPPKILYLPVDLLYCWSKGNPTDSIMTKKKKPLVFFDSFAEQRLFGQLHTLDMSPAERLSEMYRLNQQMIPGYGKRQKSRHIQVFVARPGESINEFYRRIDGEE